MKRCIYSIFVDLGNYRNKKLFHLFKDEIENSHSEYAKTIDVDYILFDKINSFLDNQYEDVNLSKYYYADILLEKYDEVLYIDFDVVPNTNENIFKHYDFHHSIPIRATVDIDCKEWWIQLYKKTETALQFNLDKQKALDKYDLLVNDYNKGITSQSFHGIPWGEEPEPFYFEKNLGIEWFFKQKHFDHTIVNQPFKTHHVKPEDIEPWDDVVKYAAVDLFSETKVLYNTGVMGFSRNTFDQLKIFEHIDSFTNLLQNVKSDTWPEYITQHIQFNNEVLFSYCEPITTHIDHKWNYFVDWESDIFLHPCFEQQSNYNDCYFRHYLNKNFEKQWPM